MSLVYQPPVVATIGTGNNNNNNSTAPKPRPGMYIGDKNDAKNYKMLVQRNITYILNVTPPKQVSYKTGVPNYFEHNNNNTPDSKSPSAFHYLRIPIYDSAISLTQLQDSIPKIISFINQALQYQQSSILIHCQRGISRSVTVAIIYMIRCLDMSYHDAITIVKRRRPLAQPIQEFVKMLQQYEMTCRSTTTMMVAPGDPPPTAGTSIGTVPTPEEGGEKAGDYDDDDDDTRRCLATSGSNEKKRSIASVTGRGISNNRIVGPQRPPRSELSPSNHTRTAVIAVITTNDVDTTPSEYDSHNNKRHKKNESMVGPQRPPPT